MSAQPQPKQDQEPRQPRSQRHGMETRLAIVETRWEDIIPTLATKVDIAETKTGIADIRSEIKMLNAKIDAQSNKLLIQLPAIILAILGLFGAVMKFWPVTPVQQPAPAVVAPVQPAPPAAPVNEQ